jgi:hypothetical protein
VAAVGFDLLTFEGKFMRIALTIAAVLIAGSAVPAAAGVNSVYNGGFELTSLTQSSQISDYFAGANVVDGWSTSGYNMLFMPGTATTTGALTQYGPGLTFHGPANGSANGYVDSPTGGNYLAADGAYIVAPITQVITGLKAGEKFTVGFDWAAAQQNGFDGPTTEQWQVSLGSQTISTAVYSNPNHGFSGWMHESFVFTATGTQEVLSFLAVGTPEGRPPFSLLDGVTGTGAVPEPATWAMLLAGFGLVGVAARRRRTAVAN